MKILNLGDWHLGVKADDEWVQSIQLDGIKQAIEYSKKNGITTWIQYGDIFDVRKAITHKTMEFAREIVQMLDDAGITLHTVVGNHDMHFKNTLTPNASTELLAKYPNVKVYDKPTTVDFDGCLIDLIPWMCEENTGEILEHIKTSSASFCVGHWELNGFYFYKGMKSHGLEPDFLKTYKEVWSGHFHTISEAANVRYIGTPWTLTAGDENDPRGFWMFDTETERMEFIPNNTTWHRRIHYPFKGKIDYKDFTNLSVRVIVTEVDKNLTKFESELEKVVHSLRVVSKIDNSVESDESEEVEVQSLQTLMEEYINAIPDITDSDREALIQYANQLYVEATQ
ncbi:SbcD-like subunit of palindrome specific endonuclease [Enterobacteria phage RB68]|jgi:DNA repair exonuclease SbcCD nuclease subunit|uniref:Calcineurin-like phosphoesterase superfamily domain protein n=3 Tax=Tequatrovirus TaxID=10663 RepID=A0A0M7QAU5_9CAUD|nr:SbcD-like subunit of palindrome specific endonuclease [Enterobacteria phage RB51]YP_009167430.1 SbcD-like subunit of palindrome specific endonuclease [Enterobacteria phage RB68]YP_009197392.1 SbcD-like subunit of palindrome specific endonuclease [Escherichia phage slur07]YP_010069890.1 SbcD-like subunit of palindrome specific endonuclease [Escherichia phage vB_EcoM_G50]EFG3114637.1 endonuclease [Escherichia coli]EHY3472304.1 metallophosphoesterase [Salmonella enterica]QNJ50156.1 recombinat